MRSLLFTILLLLTTLALGVVTLLQIREGNLNLLLGTPPVIIGEKIYPDFQPEAVTSITIRSVDQTAELIRTNDGWQVASPWKDRMDARAALAILTFANTATAQGSIPRDDIDPNLAGLGSSNVEITYKDATGQQLAYFRLGRRTPWQFLPEGENPQPTPTTYLLPLERGRKSHIYAATGDILPLFKERLSYLRDHRPFYFNPLNLQKIRIRTSQGELTLGCEKPGSPWRIIKPLDLPTNPETMKTLLEGLYELTAFKATDRAETTLTPTNPDSQNDQIALTSFGSETETVLDILPPETPDARETQATVSDRPNTLFTLPLKTEPSLISLSDLPLTVKDLRDPTLTNLNISSIRGIAIRTATTPVILISREPPAPWLATIQGEEQPANEQRLFDLLKAATETRALSFETDAAPEDLSPWGLDRPVLVLVFLAANNQTLTIRFGLDRNGSLFAKRDDNATIMRLDESFLTQIAVNPHEWRHARVWSLTRVDLTEIIRTDNISKPLTLSYDFHDDKWTAKQQGAAITIDVTFVWKMRFMYRLKKQDTANNTDVTSNLDQARANFVLDTLENLQATRWLSANDEDAIRALEKPALTFQITQNTVDDFGDITGSITKTLSLSADPTTRQIYGKISSDPSYFTLPPETFLKLQIPLLDE